MATVTSRGRASGIEPLEVAFDASAFVRLYERNAGRIFGYCLSRLGRREDAEDAAQTTFLHAIRGLRRGVVPLIESAWLLGIARNVCLARREAFGRRRRLEVVCDPHDIENVAPAAQAPREELMGLQDALAKLPAKQRRAVLLRDWRGLSYHEIATELEVSRAAVETLIFRGRQRLAELLGEEPRETRRRLASLGNLGSFFAAIKTALTGGAAAVKVAAAVVAVSTAGLAAGSLEYSPRSSGRGATISVAPADGSNAVTTQRASTAPADASPTPATVVPAARTRSESGPARPKGAPSPKPVRPTKAGSAAFSAGAPVPSAPAADDSAAAPERTAGTADASIAYVVRTVAKKVAVAAKGPRSALPVAPPTAPPAVRVAPAVPIPPAVQVPPIGPPSVPVPSLPAPAPAPPLPAPSVGVSPAPVPPLPPVAPPPVGPPPVPAPPAAPPAAPPPPPIP